ncbi:hypothetical protein GCM10027516_35460 [Niabella aquatica]
MNNNNIREILIAHCYNGKVVRGDYYLNCVFKSEGGKVKLVYATQNNPISGNRAVLPNELDMSRTFIKVNNRAKCLGLIMGYSVSPCADNFYWNENDDPEVKRINQINESLKQKSANDYQQQQLRDQQIQQQSLAQQRTNSNSSSVSTNDFDTRSLIPYTGKISKVAPGKFIMSIGMGFFSSNYDILINEQTLVQDPVSRTQRLAINVQLVNGSDVQVYGYKAKNDNKKILAKNIIIKSVSGSLPR